MEEFENHKLYLCLKCAIRISVSHFQKKLVILFEETERWLFAESFLQC